MTFEEDTELTGYMYSHLYVAAEAYNDMDMFINIQKADAEGNWIVILLERAYQERGKMLYFSPGIGSEGMSGGKGNHGTAGDGS